MKPRLSLFLYSVVALLIAAPAASAQSVSRGPYLQMGSPTAMTVRWRTNAGTDSRVRYGASAGSLNANADDATLTTEHQVRLTGLAPNTRYYYSVGSTTSTLASGADFTFFTPPSAGSAKASRIWVLGDSGTADANATAVRNAYTAFTGSQYTDAILMLGDNAYENGTDAEFQAAVFNLYAASLRQSVLWPALGNHDTADSTNPPPTLPYFQMFTLPTQAEAGGVGSGTEKYYSFDYANIHFICLDSMSSSRQPGSPMLSWLQQDLQSTTLRWIIAYWHHPPYTRGGFNSDTDAQLEEIRSNLLPILEAGGVDLVLCGHAHSYERSFLIDGHYGDSGTLTAAMEKDAGDGREDGAGIYEKDPGAHNGTVYMVAGSSGRLAGGPLNHPIMVTSLLVLGSVILDVNGDRLDARFLDKDGQVRDSFALLKAPLVTVSATQANAAEAGPAAGRVTLSRASDLSRPLSVNLTLGGTAAAGVDYQPVSGPATIPANQMSASFDLTPIADTFAEGPETAVVIETSGTGYRLKDATRAATVTIADKPADNWRFEKFGANANTPSIAGDSADPDHDGMSNLLERGFGTEPLSFSAKLPTAGASGAHLSITFPRAAIAGELTFTVEVCGDFPNWQQGSTYSGATSVPSNQYTTEVSRIPGDPEMITVRDNALMSGAARRFMRLEVSSP